MMEKLDFPSETHFADGEDDDKDIGGAVGGGGVESIEDSSHNIRDDHNHYALHNGGANGTMAVTAGALNGMKGVPHNALYVPDLVFVVRMHRKKGHFIFSKSESDEAASSLAEGNVGSSQEEQETSHCGFSSKSNPMIRHGPAGPRSLCNACGLMWANKFIIGFEALLTLLFPFAMSTPLHSLSCGIKIVMRNSYVVGFIMGILRELSKVSTIGAQEHCAKSSSEQGAAQSSRYSSSGHSRCSVSLGSTGSIGSGSTLSASYSCGYRGHYLWDFHSHRAIFALA
ncbi:hypothetical protein T459_25534 [Capsicum annuum]|uniref:GATA-type domain-containing protein n=1 Tax=Capsicum annuum TaxID=4072 RepID=A0A2G2YL08_CAPAN|nr:hypothetical protein T459_25534 [Capsicum annuum]